MAHDSSSGPHGLGESHSAVAESSNPQSTMDGMKKKKKSRKSKHKERSPPSAPSNGIESAPTRDEDQSRPSKRKHDSDPERKNKKKKKHHAAKDEIAEAPRAVAEDGPEQQTSSQPEISPEKPRQTVQNGVEEANPVAPTSKPQTVDYPTTGELNSKGKPKKMRGSRPGGKNNLKVGFFTPDEVEKLEKFKVDFCNTHGLRSETFNEMVQHSEREGAEFPCLTSIATKHEFWADIYATLPDRDRRSLYRFMRRHFQVTTQKAHEWTAEQDEELVSLMKQYPAKYTYIGKILGRSDDDVTQRWKNRLEHREIMNRGAWNVDELRAFMKTLQEIYEAYAIVNPAGVGKDVYAMDEKVIAWGVVSDSMQNRRSRQQCADKWRKIRRNVMAQRANGNPDAVFDVEEAAKKMSRWQVRSGGPKSQEFVTEDEEDGPGEEPMATSTPKPALKYGLADQQKMMALASEAANGTSPKGSPAPQPEVDVDTDAEPEPEVTYQSEEPSTPAASNAIHTPSGPPTPLSAGSDQKRDPNRMARIEEKIRKANKSKSSKKRRHSEAEAEPEPEPGPEPEASPLKEQSEKEQRRERKRIRREEKRQRELERERIEAEEAEVVKTPAKESGLVEKVKVKKHRKSHDGSDVVAAIPAATPEKEKKKRKSDMVPGATVESPESLKKHEKDEKEKKREKKEKKEKKKKEKEKEKEKKQKNQAAP
ncbi:hypothetical protein PENDEC_c002G03294 [Penicillium decumbens]|uniref:Myb-like domain-containing protein n=1 Tax=Penicillium decumbens TaxID=69771 RepID=A0A1V6PLK1_PENDC|nr:hypothetical protein PENDEC_c002G03294 [Penicillium decumbens]